MVKLANEIDSKSRFSCSNLPLLKLFFMPSFIVHQEAPFNDSFGTPESLDWRKYGAVTEVKDQYSPKDCGSCYAFAATGTLESHHYIKTGQLLNLSVQEVVDCSTANHGCFGGSAVMSYNYVIKNGISLAKDYPYAAQQGDCRADEVPRSNVKPFAYVSLEGEEDLKKAVSQFGPVEAAINALPMTFNFYKEGIYDDSDCASNKFNHAVLVVGYGTDLKLGLDYWIVKNVWSRNWGEDGYVKILRNNKTCGIGQHSFFPLMDEKSGEKNVYKNILAMTLLFLSAALLILCCLCACYCWLCKKCFMRKRRSYAC